jgi:ligand-binding SRPBCC domain-containing protein
VTGTRLMNHEFDIRDEITIHAPLERCFLLSTSVEIVERELRMHPVRGRTAGLIEGGDTVLWKGRRFGLPQFHESLIEEFRPCQFFRDRMIAGRFRAFEHDHSFDLLPDGSVHMHDEVRFTMRWGWLGEMLGVLLLGPDIRRLLRRRFRLLKRIAESEEWRSYIPAGAVFGAP